MKQITKITAVLALIISLASCQSSKSGCYDFSQVKTKITNNHKKDSNQNRINVNVVCKP